MAVWLLGNIKRVNLKSDEITACVCSLGFFCLFFSSNRQLLLSLFKLGFKLWSWSLQLRLEINISHQYQWKVCSDLPLVLYTSRKCSAEACRHFFCHALWSMEHVCMNIFASKTEIFEIYFLHVPVLEQLYYVDVRHFVSDWSNIPSSQATNVSGFAQQDNALFTLQNLIKTCWRNVTESMVLSQPRDSGCPRTSQIHRSLNLNPLGSNNL